MTTTAEGSNWQPAHPRSASADASGEAPAGERLRAQPRARARVGPMVAAAVGALAAPLRSRRVEAGEGARPGLWETRPKSLAELWADVVNGDVVPGERNWFLELLGYIAGALGVAVISVLRLVEWFLVLQKWWRLAGAAVFLTLVYILW